MSIHTAVNKTIISTTLSDMRFLQGETALEALTNPKSDEFGKQLRLFFDDGTYMLMEVVEVPRDAEHILGVHHGHWKSVPNTRPPFPGEEEVPPTIMILD